MPFRTMSLARQGRPGHHRPQESGEAGTNYPRRTSRENSATTEVISAQAGIQASVRDAVLASRLRGNDAGEGDVAFCFAGSLILGTSR